MPPPCPPRRRRAKKRVRCPDLPCGLRQNKARDDGRRNLCKGEALPRESRREGALRGFADVLELAAAGEQAVVSVSSKGYDFSKCEPVLLIPVDDVYYARKLTDFEADEHSLSAVVRVEYLGVNKDSPVFLYFAPKKTAEEPEVSLNVSRKTEERFDFGQSIVIGDYTINKQGGIMPVEVALGMANMDGEDTVYLISDALGKEVLRLVIHEGELYGIAIKDNGIVVSLEYNFAKKAYVSVISGKSLVKKETVVEIFRQRHQLRQPAGRGEMAGKPDRLFDGQEDQDR